MNALTLILQFVYSSSKLMLFLIAPTRRSRRRASGYSARSRTWDRKWARPSAYRCTRRCRPTCNSAYSSRRRASDQTAPSAARSSCRRTSPRRRSPSTASSSSSTRASPSKRLDFEFLFLSAFYSFQYKVTYTTICDGPHNLGTAAPFVLIVHITETNYMVFCVGVQPAYSRRVAASVSHQQGERTAARGQSRPNQARQVLPPLHRESLQTGDD